MRKVLTFLLIGAMVAVLGLTGCANGGSASTGFTGNEEITMANIDEHLFKNARYVDLRDYPDMFSGGYIAGFEVVPFFQYLEGRGVVRNNGWEFSSADIKSQAIIKNVFGDTDQAIVLMCGSGARAGYMKEVLEDLGYTTVFNAGGIRDYKGDHFIMGDGEYLGTRAITEAVTMANIDSYMDRAGAKYVDLRNVEDKYTGGYIDGFELISFFEYLEPRALVRNNGWNFSEEDMVSRAILQNFFGSRDREIFLVCASGTRAGYVKDALESIGYRNVHNVGGVRDYNGRRRILGDDTFRLSLN